MPFYHSRNKINGPIPTTYKTDFIEIDEIKFPQFKYIERTFAEKFLETGELRIGTVYGFANEEKYGSEIGDDSEGVRTMIRSQTDIKPSFTGIINCVNAWTFCTSSSKSLSLAEKFHSDYLIEISSIGFFHEISRAMAFASGSRLATIGKVKYENDDELHESQRSNISQTQSNSFTDVSVLPRVARSKRRRYEGQQEVRTIWSPQSIHEKLFPNGRPATVSEMNLFDLQNPRRTEVNLHIPVIILEVPAARRFAEVYSIL